MSFAAAAGDPDAGTALTYAWSFGDAGTSAQSVPTHAFAVAGSYAVTVTVNDGQGGTATQQLTLTVATADGGTLDDNDNDGITNASDSDDDNDGFSDELETTIGSNPLNGTLTPLGTVVETPTPGLLSVKKLAIALNFTAGGKDSIQLSGALPISAGFAINGKRLVIDVGGVIKTFTLDAKGAAKTAAESVKVGIKAKKGVVAEQNAALAVKFSKGTFASVLADENLTVADAKASLRTVRVIVLLDTLFLQKDQPQTYSSAKGKGKTK